MRIWPQTLVPPVITQTLYFLIFGKFIGSQIKDISGVSYIGFIIPGLVMMAVINNSFLNVAGSFFTSKFQRSIEELLVSSMSEWGIMGGYITGGIVRGLLVGLLVFVVSIAFNQPTIHHLFLILFFMILTSVVFALGGLLNGILAKSFDDISIFPTFVLIPLTYLGGVFYSIKALPPLWQKLSFLNPILYMINGFRYGFYGIGDVSIAASVILLISLAVLLTAVNFIVLRRGIGLKA